MSRDRGHLARPGHAGAWPSRKRTKDSGRTEALNEREIVSPGLNSGDLSLNTFGCAEPLAFT